MILPSLKIYKKINIVAKKSAETPEKPDDSEELASFREIALLYSVCAYNLCAIDGRRDWPPVASANRSGRMRLGSFARHRLTLPSECRAKRFVCLCRPIAACLAKRVDHVRFEFKDRLASRPRRADQLFAVADFGASEERLR